VELFASPISSQRPRGLPMSDPRPPQFRTVKMSFLFTYERLDALDGAVRFLNLLPSETDGTIRCETQNDNLSTPEPYHALSYMWGPPEPTVVIKVNGKHFTIRENLYLILRPFSKLTRRASRDSGSMLRVSTRAILRRGIIKLRRWEDFTVIRRLLLSSLGWRAAKVTVSLTRLHPSKLERALRPGDV
jgi:hypothetical protein